MNADQLREIENAYRRYHEITGKDYATDAAMEAAYPEAKACLRTVFDAAPDLLNAVEEYQVLYEREYEHRKQVEAERDALKERLEAQEIVLGVYREMTGTTKVD